MLRGVQNWTSLTMQTANRSCSMHSAVLERKGASSVLLSHVQCHGTVRCFTTVKFTLNTEALSHCIISLSHHLCLSLSCNKALMLILAKSMLLTGNKELAPSWWLKLSGMFFLFFGNLFIAPWLIGDWLEYTWLDHSDSLMRYCCVVNSDNSLR